MKIRSENFSDINNIAKVNLVLQILKTGFDFISYDHGVSICMQVVT